MIVVLYKKGLVFAIICLFIGASIVPSISGNIEVNQDTQTADLVDVGSILPDDQLDQYQYGCNGVSYSANELWIHAQSFKPSLNTCTKVVLRVFKIGLPVGNVVVNIRKILDGDDLTSISVDMSLIPNLWSYYEFDFPDISVIPEETYYIVFNSEFKNEEGVAWCSDFYTNYDRGIAWRWHDEYGWEEFMPPEYKVDMWFEEYAQIIDTSSIAIEKINGGFRVSADIKNNGTASAFDVNWSIDLEGGLILAGKHTEGVINELLPGETTTIRQTILYGIGRATITVAAGDATNTATGFILGPLVLGVK